MPRRLSESGTALLTALLLLAACGGDDGGHAPNPGSGPDISGEWTIAESFSNATQGIFCTAFAVLTLDSTANGFDGTVQQDGLCQTPAGPIDNSGTGKLTEGHTTDTTISFREPSCRYRGRLYHAPPDSADGSVTCTASTGTQDIRLTGTWFMLPGADRTPPVVTDAFILQNYPIIPGDTVGIDLLVTDDRDLTWVGVQLGAPLNLRDSIPVSGTSDRDTIRTVFPLGWTGIVESTLFALDRMGRRYEMPWQSVQVLDLVRRPLHTIDLQGEASTGAYDAKRNRFYIPQASLGQIAVVDLASFTLAAPISLASAFPPRGNGAFNLDITPGMDSLVVSSIDAADSTVAFLDLVTGTLTPVGLTDGGLKIRGVQPLLTTHGRLLLFGQRYSGPGAYSEGLWSYDLQAGTTRRQHLGMVSIASPARSMDGKVAAMLSNAPKCGWIYDPATDTLGVCHSAISASGYHFSTDTTGSLWLLGGDLLDANLGLLRSLNLNNSGSGGALAPDGSTAWFGDPLGVKQVRTSDGTVLMTVRVPGASGNQIRMLPDGHRLVVLNNTGGTTITLVDLP